MTSFLVMVLNPGVQGRAQAQIDAVGGKDRLPTIDDRPLLPILDAILWETLRYRPIVPLCERFRALAVPVVELLESRSGSPFCCERRRVWWIPRS
jgi:cytochrome P450